jgi:outer membrane protein
VKSGGNVITHLPTLAASVLLSSAIQLIAQSTPSAAQSAAVQQAGAAMAESVPAPPAGEALRSITLQDALQQARANSAQFQTAATAALLAREDRVQARAGLLPSVSYTTSYIYTQGNGTPSGRFIANNGVHEYLAQGNAHQVIGLGLVAEYRRTGAALALAKAKAEIAARGLVLTLTRSYYGLIVAERKVANAQAAADQARRFVTLSQELEQGGEVAHSDVIKAQLQSNEREAALQEARLASEKAKLELTVLLFPDFTLDFTVVDDLRFAAPLPTQTEVEQLAAHNNADIQAATAGMRVASAEVTVARSGHLPTLTFDYWYGIDANHFATSTDGVRNLGYAAEASLTFPIFNWGAIQSKVRQAELRRKLARVQLSEAQRTALANLRAFWSEASLARSQLELLRNSADLAAESLRLTELRYKAGEATALEVVDAGNSLSTARNAYDDAEARYRIALANLQTLTGPF